MDRLLKLLLGVEAVIFILASASHLGLPVPWLVGPRILPAAVIEGLCGLVILYGSLHGGARTAFVCQTIAFAGVLLGLAALTLAGAPRYPITDLGQVVLLAALGPGLLLSDRMSRAA
jgi:hypothetical protein